MQEKTYRGLSPEGLHRLSYLEWGEGARTLICVHGLTRNAWDFTWLGEALKDRYRVIAPNIVGRGTSASFKNPMLYNYPQYMADLQALLTHLKLSQVDWVGTSMGGILGIMMTAMPHTPVQKLVLNDIGPFVSKEGLQRLAAYAPHAHTFSTLQEGIAFLKSTLKGYQDVTEAQWQFIARHSFSWDSPQNLWKSSYDPQIAFSLLHPEKIPDIDLWPLWEGVKCPTLLLHGKDSDILSQETASRMQKKTNLTYKGFEGKGHALPLISREECGLIRDWLG